MRVQFLMVFLLLAPTAMALSSHPFDTTPREQWIDVLIQQGPEAALNATRDPLTEVAFLQVGDIDGDGLDDVLHMESGPDLPLTVKAMTQDGSKTFWSLEEDGYLYPLGDVDGDGVEDLLRHDGFGMSVSISGAVVGGTGGGPMPETVSLVSGKDGKVLWDVTLEHLFEVTWYSTPTPYAGVDYDEWRLRTTSLASAQGATGAMVIGSEYQDQTAGAIASSPAGFAWIDLTLSQRGTVFGRVDASGAFAATPQTYWHGDRVAYLYDVWDMTGDAIPDALMVDASGGEELFLWTPAGIEWIDVESPVTTAWVQLVNGADGEVVWTYEGDPFIGFVDAFDVRNFHGQGSEVAVFEYGAEPTSPNTMRTLITYIDAATGTVRAEETHDDAVVILPYLDVDQDGTTEGLVLTGPFDGDVAGVTLEIRNGNGAALWTLDDLESHVPALLSDPRQFIDMDGDGYPELPLLKDDTELQLRDARDGSIKWSRSLSGTLQLARVSDVTSDGGDEIVALTFDGKDADSDEYADADGHITLLRGSDGKTVWKRQVHAATEEQTSYRVVMSAFTLQRAGVPAVAVNLDGSRIVSITCGPGGCQTSSAGPPIEASFIFGGANGDVLLADVPILGDAAASKDKVQAAKAEVGEAGEELQEAAKQPVNDAPVPTWVVVAAVGAALIARRRTNTQ